MTEYLIKFRADPKVDDVFVECTDPVHQIQSNDNEVEYVFEIDCENGVRSPRDVTAYMLAEVESQREAA